MNWLILLLPLAVLIILLILIRNQAVALKNEVLQAKAAIAANIQKYVTILPQMRGLQAALKAHELDTLKELTDRFELIQGNAMERTKVRELISATEDYFKTAMSENIEFDQQTLRVIREDIAASEIVYNKCVKIHNDYVLSMPQQVILSFFGFEAINDEA